METADTTYTIQYDRYADPPFLQREPLRVGEVPPTLGTPSQYVCIWRGERPYLRIDLYDSPPGPNELDAPELYIPYFLEGDHLLLVGTDAGHFVDLRHRRFSSTPWFMLCGIHPLKRGYLVRDAQQVSRLDAQGHVLWEADLFSSRLLALGTEQALVHGDYGDLGDPDYWRIDLKTGGLHLDVLEP